jgi:hypothetical protein
MMRGVVCGVIAGMRCVARQLGDHATLSAQLDRIENWLLAAWRALAGGSLHITVEAE